MFHLVLTMALVSSVQADAGALRVCYKNRPFCITLPDGPITAEAGLCVVIPCSFTVERSFTPQHLVWFKCDPSKEKCEESNIIFDSYNYISRVHPEFRGRVSLLESDFKQLNCSIVVNDLKESDSGTYELSVEAVWNIEPDSFFFSKRASISVKGLEQKPTLEVPLMRAGEEAALTCTAPGLCSGSSPGFSWTLSGAGGIIDFKTEDLIVAQRHSFTLTFKSSAELHGADITCKVSLAGGVTAEETATLHVTTSADVAEYSESSPAGIFPAIAAASLVLNLVLTVVFTVSLVVLWKLRKKVKSAEAERTDMSLHRTNSSPEYEDIGLYQN